MRLFGGGRRRTFGHGKELGAYRNDLHERTKRIDARLADVSEEIEALRRRDIDPETAIERLTGHEEELETESDGIQVMFAPSELHGLHMEYEANLERSIRGILVVERGCAITRLPHRPPEDEEPYTYYKRGYQNVTHARMRMAEIVEVLLTWEPGKPADATVATRLERQREQSPGA
jgi:hypothetical protein